MPKIIKNGISYASSPAYESKPAAQGGTDLSLVTTGEKYTWNTVSGKLDTPTVVTQTVTVNGGASVTGSGTIYVWGKVVTLSLQVNYPAAGTNLTLAWLPGQGSNLYRPTADVWLSCDCYNTSGKTAEAKITSSGNIVVSQTEGGKDLKISGTWICN